MQHLASCPKTIPFRIYSECVLTRVRFLAYHRIKPHAPPLVRAPVNSFEFQPCDHTPQAERLTLSLRPGIKINPRTSAQSLRLGLPGYLIPFATLAFALQRQLKPSKPPSPPVFLAISKHFTAPPQVPLAPASLKSYSSEPGSSVEPRDFKPRL